MIKLYTMPTCAPCHVLMTWLDEQGIEYEEISARGVSFVKMTPTAEIDGELFVGIDAIKDRLE